MATNNGWSVDKHIPIALILAIAMQTGGAIWFAAKMDSRVESLEQQSSLTKQIIDRIDNMNARMVRIETLVEIRRSADDEEKGALNAIK